jgi:hypothetical protein
MSVIGGSIEKSAVVKKGVTIWYPRNPSDGLATDWHHTLSAYRRKEQPAASAPKREEEKGCFSNNETRQKRTSPFEKGWKSRCPLFRE